MLVLKPVTRILPCESIIIQLTSYRLRSIAYENLGKKSKAKADSEKAKSLGVGVKGPH